MKLRIGDEILVTAGKDKGQKGRVEKVFSKENKVLVPGVNVYKKTRKGNGQEAGGVFDLPRPLNVANVALICPNCKKPTRVAYSIDKSGAKTRTCAKCKREIKVDKKEAAK